MSSDIRQMVVDYKYAEIPETPKYRKKKAKKTPKKADHKHQYQNVIIEYTYPRNYPVSRLAGKPAYALESYCKICGKLSSPVWDEEAARLFPHIYIGHFGFIALMKDYQKESEDYKQYCMTYYPHYSMPDYYESAFRGQVFLDLDKIVH